MNVSFVWKGEKVKEGKKYVQQIEKIADMTPERLKECWKHCDKMLHSNDPKHLGRYNVLEEVTSQVNKCNTELLLRYFENSYQKRENGVSTKRFSLMVNLREMISNNPEINDWSKIPISKISSNLPDEFKDISVLDVLDGCIDNLGAYDKQHLTMTFITRMGLWFTKAEENELGGNSNIERVKIAKKKLHLPEELVLRFSEKGLSYHEMRAMLTLPKKQKYSDMTTEQLVTLRNKILLRLSREIDSHIYTWKTLQRQIELVAKSKKINLNND
jgi:plasmid maintenance system antidote protein VapI